MRKKSKRGLNGVTNFQTYRENLYSTMSEEEKIFQDHCIILSNILSEGIHVFKSCEDPKDCK